MTLEMLDELTVEFLAIFNKCPSRLRKRVMQQPGVNASAMTSSDKSASGSSSKTRRQAIQMLTRSGMNLPEAAAEALLPNQVTIEKLNWLR